MGYGCYFTNKETGTRSFWIDIDPYNENEEENLDIDLIFDDLICDVSDILDEIGYIQEKDSKFYNGLYDLYLEYGPMGDKIIFRLEPLEDCDSNIYNLAMANFDKCYDKIARTLISYGYELRIATSGYTSGRYIP